MPYMNVIPPGLDFSNLKVDLPEDPVVKEMLQHKPAYGGVTPKATAQDSSPKSSGKGTPKAGESRHSKKPFSLHHKALQRLALCRETVHCSTHAMLCASRL